METFLELFGSLLVFCYECFDRIVIHGYLIGLSRPANVVYFFRQVLGLRCITPQVLAQPTREYQGQVEAYARRHQIPFEWAKKGVRKEDFVRPFLRRLERENRYGVYYILRSMEQGNTFRSSPSQLPDADPDDRYILKKRSRFTYYYFYLRDERLGPMAVQIASYLPFTATYYLNGHSFIEQELRRDGIDFRKDDNAFLAVSDPQALQAAAHRLSPELIQERLEYWTRLLGPQFSSEQRQAMDLERTYAHSQIEYCRNFIFRRPFPLHKIFERSCDLGLARLLADQLTKIFGQRVTPRSPGHLDSSLRVIQSGHHVLRAACKRAYLKAYEKASTFLRLEVCSNNLLQFGLRKGLARLPEVRSTLAAVTDRFAAFQALSLNVHVDFPLFQRLALPVVVGRTKIPGLKIHDTRLIRLMEILLHQGATLTGWRTAQIHSTLLTAYGLSTTAYTLTQLRYDLRKLKAHGLLERPQRAYAYRLTSKGVRAALLFVLFHQRVCGPLADSLFRRRPHPPSAPPSPLEAAYHRADAAIQNIIQLLAA